jgi:hypothetical protein
MVLLNHFGGSAERLSIATGISARSLRAVFHTVDILNKHSPKLHSEEYRAGFARARHSMTDSLRRRVQSARKGKYDAPIVRTPTNVLAPEQSRYKYLAKGRGGKVTEVISKSLWYHYNVEFLSDDQIWHLLYTTFDTFMATGQFNIARYVYLTDADIYPGENGFKDKDYRADAEASEVISMGSRQFPFPEYDSAEDFANDVLDDWGQIQLKGGIRITKLYFAYMQDIAQGEAMEMARRSFEAKKKAKAKRGSKRKGGRQI